MVKIPEHLAIIMDGNGRWAEQRGYPRILGHREGARNVRRISTLCSRLGVKVLTLYAFSTENWARPSREISLLMKLMRIYAVRERPLFMRENTQVRVIGDLQRLPLFVREALEETIALTRHNTGMVLQLALSYSGRDELLRAVKKIIAAGKSADDISEQDIESQLDTAGTIHPDLLIRTGGEQRTSNFLIWQAAYSELYFCDAFWPEFDEYSLLKSFESFAQRDRRFGGVSKLSKVELASQIS